MQTDDVLDPLDTKPLRLHRLWYVPGCVLSIMSLVIEQPLLFLAALFALVIACVPAWWYRYALRSLEARQQVHPQRLFFGEDVALTVTIENQKRLPLIGLACQVPLRPPLPFFSLQEAQRETLGAIDYVGSLWGFERTTRRYHLRCFGRGFYMVGPFTLEISDPFGWMKRRITLPLYDTLLVYPPLASLEDLGLPGLHLMGEAHTTHGLFEDPLYVVGVREYQLDDDPRRIHWKTSARAGELRSKVYEYSYQRRVLVILEMGTPEKTLVALSWEMQEFAIAVAASVAIYSLDEGYMVGLLTNCAALTGRELSGQTVGQAKQHWGEPGMAADLVPEGIYVPFDRDAGQYERLLTTFARLVPYLNVPMEEVLERQDEIFTRGTSVILVSAVQTLSPVTIERLQEVRSKGSVVQCVLVGDQDMLTLAEAVDFPIYAVGGSERWHALIHAIANERRAPD
ncbi:MAG TPA: DUF58 domain-containing protein [Ktedonobacteraceae bacterium]|nr:DUF58 domain-containing protein [Ktedonobacteraceae bacterium]